jgi:hypothetical protein
MHETTRDTIEQQSRRISPADICLLGKLSPLLTVALK